MATRSLVPLSVGSSAYVRDFVEGYERRALRLLDRLRSLLVPSSGRVCHRDEFDVLVRFCVWPRLRHFMRTLPPGDVTTVLH
jgi:hypothetical protein